MQMCACKVTFVLRKPPIDERHSCNNFPKTLFFIILVKYLVALQS